MLFHNSTTTISAEELKARFNPEGSLKRRQQLIMREMVIELDRICKKHNIPYFLYGGTLLGALRHDGFIPWDDDLDVGLLRKDYLKLMKVLPCELPEHIVLQTNDTDKNYFYFFAKLRHKNSFLDEHNFDSGFKERGIYIDIFPFEKSHLWAQKLRFHSLAYNFYRAGNGNERALRKIRILTCFNRYFTIPILRTFCRLTGGKTLTYSYGIPFHVVYDENDIFPLTTHVFEGVQLSVPGNSHAMLQKQFGDYMKLPDDLDNLYHHVERLEIYE